MPPRFDMFSLWHHRQNAGELPEKTCPGKALNTTSLRHGFQTQQRVLTESKGSNLAFLFRIKTMTGRSGSAAAYVPRRISTWVM